MPREKSQTPNQRLVSREASKSDSQEWDLIFYVTNEPFYFRNHFIEHVTDFNCSSVPDFFKFCRIFQASQQIWQALSDNILKNCSAFM